jgi:hypothetical protein
MFYEKRNAFLKKIELEKNYQDLMIRINQYQQNRQLYYEIILLVFISGFLINVLASSTYSYLNTFLDIIQINIIILFIMSIVIFISHNIFLKYKPYYETYLNISYSMHDIDLFFLEIKKILNYFQQGVFKKEDFISWYELYKKSLIEDEYILLTHSFGLKFYDDVEEWHGRKMIFKSNYHGLKVQLDIVTIPLGFYRDPPSNLSIHYNISFKILNPEHPESDEFFYNLRNIYIIPFIEDHMYVIIKNFEEYCKKFI